MLTQRPFFAGFTRHNILHHLKRYHFWDSFSPRLYSFTEKNITICFCKSTTKHPYDYNLFFSQKSIVNRKSRILLSEHYIKMSRERAPPDLSIVEISVITCLNIFDYPLNFTFTFFPFKLY